MKNLTYKLKGLVLRAGYFALLRCLYPAVYAWHRHRTPLNPKKAVFVEASAPRFSNNYTLLHDALVNQHGFEAAICFMHKGHAPALTVMRNTLDVMREVADAKYVFVNEACNVFSRLNARPETVFVQTWHACGAFKKFGATTMGDKFGPRPEIWNRYPAHNFAHFVPISSPHVAWAYEASMSMPPEKVLPLGVSRTDVFFDEANLARARAQLLEVFPAARGKKVILYAPTFRGFMHEAKTVDRLDVRAFAEALGDEYVLLLQHHPQGEVRPEVPASCAQFAADVTDTLRIEDLLCVADVAISDYSSIVCEFSLFERPMLFYCFDLEEQLSWRGFYYDYDEVTPGPKFKTNAGMLDYIQHLSARCDGERVRAFGVHHMAACDGHSTERILNHLFALG